MMTGDEKKMSPDQQRSSLRKKDYAYMREMKDPCVKEHEKTLKCLDDSGYDRTQCEDFFLNYRICRKFWARVESDRKKRGLVPHLPIPSERESVKKDYQHFLS